MQIYKFGGASVKDSDSVRNLAEILKKTDINIVVVISAMGKTTNALEQITELYFHSRNGELKKKLDDLIAFHYKITKELFPRKDHDIYKNLENQFVNLRQILEQKPTLNYDFDYDQIVSNGEILSTLIVEAYLSDCGLKTKWIDIRESLKTSDKFREGRVDWELTGRLAHRNFQFDDADILVTQGFIASTINNNTTTLGREGSDYSAAILAYVLEAEKVIIWKDVPGVLNADPKWFDDTILLEKISYKDAIELAFYGTSVIHPKTIQPLKKKNIPLQVRSFIEPDLPGTLVSNQDYEKLIPSFIFKMDQVLMSIAARDLSFITEDYLEIILGAFAKHGLNINLMQNSATSFKICINNDKNRILRIAEELKDKFFIDWENGLELVTIRYFDQETLHRVSIEKEIVLEQYNTTTAQMLMRDLIK